MHLKIITLILGLVLTVLPVIAAPTLAQADGCEYIDQSIKNYDTEIPKFPRYCTMAQFLQRILNIAFAVIAGLSLIFMVIGGYQYMTAHGNEEQATSGRKTVVYALVGLIVVLLAVTLVNILVNLILFG
jgi:hypothetical protein